MKCSQISSSQQFNGCPKVDTQYNVSTSIIGNDNDPRDCFMLHDKNSMHEEETNNHVCTFHIIHNDDSTPVCAAQAIEDAILYDSTFLDAKAHESAITEAQDKRKPSMRRKNNLFKEAENQVTNSLCSSYVQTKSSLLTSHEQFSHDALTANLHENEKIEEPPKSKPSMRRKQNLPNSGQNQSTIILTQNCAQIVGNLQRNYEPLPGHAMNTNSNENEKSELLLISKPSMRRKIKLLNEKESQSNEIINSDYVQTENISRSDYEESKDVMTVNKHDSETTAKTFDSKPSARRKKKSLTDNENQPAVKLNSINVETESNPQIGYNQLHAYDLTINIRESVFINVNLNEIEMTQLPFESKPSLRKKHQLHEDYENQQTDRLI